MSRLVIYFGYSAALLCAALGMNMWIGSFLFITFSITLITALSLIIRSLK